MAETYPWSDIISLNEALFSALERGTLSWLSWDPLEKWWEMMENALRTQAASRSASSKRPAPAPAPSQPAARTRRGAGLSLLQKKKVSSPINVGQNFGP